MCRFHSDSQAELDLVCELARSAGAADAVIANHFAEGGKGALDLAGAIARACAVVREAREPTFRYLFPLVPLSLFTFKIIIIIYFRI
jgi:formyltetrahydrofolate synthetase